MAVATLSNIHKRYKGMPTPALDGINLSVDPGNIVVLVGPNGSGKTTAMEILSGLRTADSGSATINNREVVPGGRHRFDVGVQLQEAGLPQRLKVKEAVRSVSSLYRDPGPVDSILDSLGLSDRMNQLIDRLSGGWQRRLDIALACIGRPRLLILDEPTSGLDPTARAELWEFLRDLRSRGMSVLASTHDLSEAEAFADRIVVLHSGRIILDGPVAEVLAVAGGTWRLRLTGVVPGTASSLAAFGVRPLQQGDNISIVGEREELTQIAGRIETERADGRISYIDLLSGPVRLEDVYAFAAAPTNNGPEHERNRHDG
ncbi:ABC transporter ATP-binding protein [Arthrobacter sp. H35-D1]|uniref:ABC transporter ATP-binding protein n=1 Tax=Arthrobacter sp. H35-D1 TaxID=3046202 RepID=UPI0024B9C59F|nr:ABC transporter ATP-binding protein [Arthrobacter sp. H35-D1]MDJ0312189.1 ABC transporter ATP-binding protein [Arthrobacter sp. H35-D1]